MRGVWISGLAAALAAACTPTPPGEAPPLVRATLAPGGAAAATGEARVTVLATRDGLSVPAQCQLDGAGFAATFAAPAQVAAPSFGAASQPVRIACEADGRRGGRLVQPSVRPMGGGGVVPVIGVGISSGGDTGVSLGGWWGGGGLGGPRSYAVRYPDVEVPLD